jgi:hypothetical protein
MKYLEYFTHTISIQDYLIILVWCMFFVLSYTFVFEWKTLQLENLYICLDSVFEPFEDLNFRKEDTRNFLLSMQANKDQEIEILRHYYIYVY